MLWRKRIMKQKRLQLNAKEIAKQKQNEAEYNERFSGEYYNTDFRTFLR